VVERGGRHWLFCEDYPWKAGRASISFAEVRPDGQTGQSRTALRDEEHFAYPCVFEREGEVFMVPDRSKSGRLELYRAVAFPQRWQLEDVLMHGTVVDPTFFEHGDRLWLFASVDVEPVGPQKSELSLFHSRSLLGPWTPHPRNPVVTDVRRARPAGRPFRRGAELIRPGQDNSRGYGSAVTLSRVEVLDTEDYREIPIGRIGPERLPRACGLHTYNADSAYETIDFCRALPRLPLPRRRREG
jgi:hypothetical protein